MKTYKEIINEIFDSPYKFKGPEVEKTPIGMNHHYTFKTSNGDEYKTSIFHHGDKIGSISFQNDSEDSTGITGTEKQSAHKVFSTVHHIIKHHLAKNPNITNIHFSGYKKDLDNLGNNVNSLSRVKLYDHLVKKMSNKYTRNDCGPYMKYNIHRDDIK